LFCSNPQSIQAVFRLFLAAKLHFPPVKGGFSFLGTSANPIKTGIANLPESAGYF
jgi:hypothetical protein